MIEQRLEENEGFRKSMGEGYCERVELLKGGDYSFPRWENDSFTQRTAKDFGSATALYFFPLLHPVCEYNNAKNLLKKIGNYFRRNQNTD